MHIRSAIQTFRLIFMITVFRLSTENVPQCANVDEISELGVIAT